MKASDLRIGNYILSINDEILTVSEIRETKIVAKGIDSKNRCYLFEHIKPIPLTEEILLKCGDIIKISSGKYIDCDSDLRFNIEDGDWDNPSLDISIRDKYITCVEHVHELQNIYKEITKTELEIKL